MVFVVWTGNLWCLLGLPVIYDIYISKLCYRKFGHKHTELRQKSRTYNSIMGWVDPLLFGVVAATILRLFFFENYTIPTGSMEKSLLIGDYLTVSKVAYGPKMPNTPISFPLVHNTMPFSLTKNSYTERIKWPYHRLKGRGEVKRDDVVVFNFPEGDTVYMNGNANDVFYYDHVRAYGWERAQTFGKTQYRPVDKRENYVKRCVGLPGDTIEIRQGKLYVNGVAQADIPGMQYSHHIYTNGNGLNPAILEDMGISRADIGLPTANGTYTMPLTAENAEKIQSFGNVTEIIRQITPAPESSPYCFPFSDDHLWSEDNYGPLWIPQKGATVDLTPENLPIYRRIIRSYEGHDLEVRDNTIYIDNTETTSYTFEMNYYWMMGDNRHASADSRFWGFVPEDHIVGKPSFVWLSLDPEKKFPANIRWSRMFRKIK